MNITQVKLKFERLPEFRDKDIVSNGASKIIIDSVNQESVDIGLLHNSDTDRGLAGIRYHYIIKNGNYDGMIYYCRPLVYQNELLNASGPIKNSILIGMAGFKTNPLTQNQKDSLVKLILYLLSNENYLLPNVNFLHEINGTAADIPDWQEVKNTLYAEKEKIATELEKIGLSSENGILSNSEFDVLVTTSVIRSFKKISRITRIPVETIASMNPSIPDPDNIMPDTHIFLPKNSIGEELRASQQKHIAAQREKILEEQVNIAIIEKEDYIAAKNDPLAFDIYSTNNKTQARGGEKEPFWYKDGYELPGYHNAVIQLVNSGSNSIVTIPFLISPSSFNDSRSNSPQIAKTSGGWFVMRTGKNIGSLSFSGYMLDTKTALERHDFLEQYKGKIEDQKNSKLEFTNDYHVRIIVEGREYSCFMQALNFSKSAVQPFLYQYSMQFGVLNDRKVYDTSQRAVSILEAEDIVSASNIVEDSIILSNNLYNELNKDIDSIAEPISTRNITRFESGRLRI